MKKALCILLAALFIFALAGCGEKDTLQSSSEAEETSEQKIPEKIAINGSDISEYRIVYREANLPAKYLFAANELRDFIKDNWGVTLDVISETAQAAPSERELLVGMCSGREISEEYYYKTYENYGDYITVVSGSTVLFASGYANGAHFAIKEFCSGLLSGDGTVTDMTKSGSGKVLKVACVGDSITQGINSTDAMNKTYPVYFQEMLGLDYYVKNFGLSGYSICRTDEYAYNKHAVYRQSLDFEPDIVIFALGTNDCNPGQSYKEWEGTDRKEVFVESTKALLDSYRSLETAPQIFICLPCSLFKVGADGWNAVAWTERNEKYSVPLLKEIAGEYGLPVVDLWSWSKEHPSVFTDGLHPKDETYKDFAKAIYDSVKEAIKKPDEKQ